MPTSASSSRTPSAAPRRSDDHERAIDKIGPTLADLIAFRKAVDDAMVAVGTVRDLRAAGAAGPVGVSLRPRKRRIYASRARGGEQHH
jgi:hypothetical protein